MSQDDDMWMFEQIRDDREMIEGRTHHGSVVPLSKRIAYADNMAVTYDVRPKASAVYVETSIRLRMLKIYDDHCL